jgi:hypothetical protein
MGMEDPLPTFAAFVERIRDAHPNFAYIHVIEKLERPDMDPVNPHDANGAGPNDVLRKIWGERPYIAAGGFHRVSANSTVEKYGGLIAFGRHFIANVSCAYRLTRVETILTVYPRTAWSSLALEGRDWIDTIQSGHILLARDRNWIHWLSIRQRSCSFAGIAGIDTKYFTSPTLQFDWLITRALLYLYFDDLYLQQIIPMFPLFGVGVEARAEVQV